VSFTSTDGPEFNKASLYVRGGDVSGSVTSLELSTGDSVLNRDKHFLRHGEVDEEGDPLDDAFVDRDPDAKTLAYEKGQRFLNVFHRGRSRSKSMGK
jgi:hypothetical protein